MLVHLVLIKLVRLGPPTLLFLLLHCCSKCCFWGWLFCFLLIYIPSLVLSFKGGSRDTLQIQLMLVILVLMGMLVKMIRLVHLVPMDLPLPVQLMTLEM